SGSRFSLQQHRRISSRYRLGDMKRLEPRLARSNGTTRAISPLHFRLERLVFAPQVAMLGGASNYRHQLFVFERLLDVVEGAVVAAVVAVVMPGPSLKLSAFSWCLAYRVAAESR